MPEFQRTPSAIAKTQRLFFAKSGPTHHSTGPARKAAQAGEFKRWATGAASDIRRTIHEIGKPSYGH
jgi:hypothetical protein